MSTQKLGHSGESLASKYLIREGHQIIRTNYYTRMGEIDIISKENDIYVFCEVKTRVSSKDSQSQAISAFSYEKQKKFILTMNYYLSTKQIMNPYRIDLIVVYRDYKKIVLRHFQNYEVCERLQYLL